MGKSRNMETKPRDGADSSTSKVRPEAVPSAGDGQAAAAGLPRGNQMALSESLASLTLREQAIFDAGLAEGAAQVMEQLGQHAPGRHHHAMTVLAALPPAVSKGAEAGAKYGRRVLLAGKALLGKR